MGTTFASDRRREKGKEAELETKRDSQRERLEATAQKQQRLVVKGLRKPVPELTIVPAGSFMMGSPRNEEGRSDSEGSPTARHHGHSFAVWPFSPSRSDEFKELSMTQDFARVTFSPGATKARRGVWAVFASPSRLCDSFCAGRQTSCCVRDWLNRRRSSPGFEQDKKNYRLLTEANGNTSHVRPSTAYWCGRRDNAVASPLRCDFKLNPSLRDRRRRQHRLSGRHGAGNVSAQ